MKKVTFRIFALSLVMILFGSTAFAAELPEESTPTAMYWAEVQSMVNADGVTNAVQTMGSRYFTPHVGAWFWTVANRTWGEGYLGPIFAVTNEFQVGVAAGFETVADKGWRFGYVAGYYSGDHYAELIGEYGGSGLWLRTHGNYQINDWFGLGAHLETGLGLGPRVRLRLPPDTISIPIELWGAPLFDWTGNGKFGTYLNCIGGLRINL